MNKKIIRLIVVLLLISTMFGIGFIVGGTLIYNEKTSELSELKNQIDIIRNSNNINYYNDNSLSNIYNDVKDSIEQYNKEGSFRGY